MAKSLDYKNEFLIFKQKDNRVSWKQENECVKNVKHYQSVGEAREAIKELQELGHQRSYFEEEEHAKN